MKKRQRCSGEVRRLIDKSLIGQKHGPLTFDVEKGAIRAFAEAIGSQNPLYYDESHAKSQGYPSLLAPFTFPTTFRPRKEQEVEWYQNLDRSKILHAEQEYQYDRRLFGGEQITCYEKVIDVYEKQGKSGKMTFIVRDREGFDSNGERVFVDRFTLVVRE
ncbi:MaoC family dehydratase N-terminal domain-containing protein [Alicyclobacillus dauci]|uniref:MaoC family dehydratase N-terminal domain-containing protein n=1 Tax=Alicyclobacillus dauci TaxID=1475485 RepID=A0ABY6Z1W3_9BACL|nr:MaoC family dehydratase N-terminal domain-containing protein [Alicyclobacillus dauci]WAH36206.1 MaoC family dehydratase N-terminal domain-containing protein [Alicyclobacillus dauci]